MGNWDEFVRTGDWDTGARPPMALGVEAAGVVAAVGAGVRELRPGDAVTTHSLPAGGWAEKFIAAADHVAPVPSGMPMTVAAALPVPALTADQALDAVTVRPDQTVLVHGAGGVTGGVLVRPGRPPRCAGHRDREPGRPAARRWAPPTCSTTVSRTGPSGCAR